MAVKVKNTKSVNPAENREKLKKEKNQKNDLQKVPLMCQFFRRFPGNSPSLAKGGTGETGGVVAARMQTNRAYLFYRHPVLDTGSLRFHH